MKRLKAIIVDDELPARENLNILLTDYFPEIKVVGMAENITTAKKAINALNPDVVFLDIRMPSGTEGFDLLDDIGDHKFMVVFVTAFKDYAIRAFKANAIHYVLKPIDIDDLREAVEKLIKNNNTFNKNPSQYSDYMKNLQSFNHQLSVNTYSPRIAISHSKGYKIVETNQIVRVEAKGNYTQLFFNDNTTYLDTRTLLVYEELLNPKMFFRTHKSHIINLQYLSDYISDNGRYAVLKDNSRVPVARLRHNKFVQKLKQL